MTEGNRWGEGNRREGDRGRRRENVTGLGDRSLGLALLVLLVLDFYITWNDH